MATRSMSPGGALLRASRVFSIPPPLPKPKSDLSSTAIFGSDTSTLPHPTQLSITTPPSALARGDWGFKRPLPLRATTRTSTPILRVEAIDTLEHITEFGSAADHSLTLQKWQEMGVPITTPPIRKPGTTGALANDETNTSVFEDQYDSTVHKERGLLDKDDTRWKFKGPWLAGLSEGEFTTYVQRQIHGRKIEFRAFLRTACAEDMTKEQRLKAGNEGEDVPVKVQASDITEAQLDAYVKKLRGEMQTLYNLIRKFLDLPPPPNRNATSEIAAMGLDPYESAQRLLNKTLEGFIPSNSPYADSGPPKTHPSAGLGYTRSSAYLVNHPVYGPQKTKAPVQARVLMPKGAATGNFTAVLGVAGVAVNIPQTIDPKQSFDKRKFGKGAQPDYPGIQNIEPDKDGGSKFWVEPKSATIDAKGRVQLIVAQGDPEAVAVKENKTDEIPTMPRRQTNVRHTAMSSFADFVAPTSTSQPRPTNIRAGYGISPDEFMP